MKILNVINRGGFGKVERIQLPSGEILARKVFDPLPDILISADERKLIKRFQREVKIQQQLNPDFFIPIIEHSLSSTPMWFTMPLAERNFWVEILESRQNSTVPTEALLEILNALEELHNMGYVHRDLKPQNILFHANSWKLSDFGLVMLPSSETTRLTSTESAWGTAGYCAPEQIEDFKNVTHSADIYSFGCILHDIFVGTPRVPYQSYTGEGPIGLIIEKCTEIVPARRFKSVNAIRNSLFRLLVEENLLHPSPSTAEWIESLSNVQNWDIDVLLNFTRYVKHIEEDTDRYAIFIKFDDDIFEKIRQLDHDAWKTIGCIYCDWVKYTAFRFELCDTIIMRLNYLYTQGDYELKSFAVLSAATMGSSHNRWFVMRHVIKFCNKEISDDLARRISIDIIAEEAKQDFVNCADNINLSIDQYHQIIFDVLK
jgi:eukaryotic-like serine/threonine-protein kinase